MPDRLDRLDTPTREALVALGSVMLDLRRSRSLTQRALASRCGLSQSSISRLETGKAPWLSAVWIARLLAGLDSVLHEPTDPRVARSLGDAGWRLLMRRFEAARRRRELRTTDERRRAARDLAMLDLAGELGDVHTPVPDAVMRISAADDAQKAPAESRRA